MQMWSDSSSAICRSAWTTLPHSDNIQKQTNVKDLLYHRRTTYMTWLISIKHAQVTTDVKIAIMWKL